MSQIHKLTMPKWGLTMQEGTVASWLVEVGDQITPGTEIVEVETDKSSQPVEINASGILRRKLLAEGEVAPVGALMAVIADSSVSEAEIDAFIAEITGVAPVAENSAAVSSPAPDSQVAVSSQTVGTATKRMSRMRAAIAKTVTDGWCIPQFPVTVAINMSKAEALYRRLKETGAQISINDVIITSSALALRKFPMMIAELSGDSYILHEKINISVAVGLEDGLLMPVIRDCQNLSLPQIGEKSRELIQQVKNGTVSTADLTGGNFSISNLGMFGVEQFAALVPPGQTAILAVSGIKDEAVVIDGQITVSRIMRATLSADHRVVDGLNAAQFLAELKRILETPDELQG